MYTEPFQRATLWLERGLNNVFSQKYNPFYYHGALPNFFIWALFITGLILFAYYQPTLATAYSSLHYITYELPFGNLFRSLHRYASDGMMIFVILHMCRVWFTDRYREYRILPWVTGVVLLAIVFAIGLTGYLLIWDQEAVTLANITFNLLKRIPFVGESISNFVMAGQVISDYTLTRFMFLHLGFPLLMMFMLWMHYLRITRPVSEPPLPLVLMMAGGLFVTSAALPVTLEELPKGLNAAVPVLSGPGSVTSEVYFDLLYAWPQYLAAQGISPILVLLLVLAVPLGLLVVPYLQKKAMRGQYAQVTRENCTGCSLCYNDCPYEAITMVDRGNDGTRFKRLAVVDAGRCANCGLCVGACAFKAIEIPRRDTNTVLAEIEATLAAATL